MFNIMRKMKVFSFGPSAVFALGVIIGVLTLAKPAMAQTPTSFNSGWFWQNPWPQPDNLHSVVTPNTQTIVAVGALGRFIMSTDGGATWTVQSLGNYDLLSISCSDANTCTAVGNDNSGTLGIILRTTDGGATWTVRSTGNHTGPISVSCTDVNTCTVAGSGNNILRTTDGGVTWNQQSVGPAISFLGISCTDFNTCTVVAGGSFSDGYILRTTDGGATWTTVYANLSSAFVTAISCADSNTCMAVQGSASFRLRMAEPPGHSVSGH